MIWDFIWRKINFAEIIIALVPARSLAPTQARCCPFEELLKAQLLSLWLQQENPPHPSTRLRIGRVHIIWVQSYGFEHKVLTERDHEVGHLRG